MYEGAFKANSPYGYGRKIEKNGNYYIGEFKFGAYDGHGTLYDKNGKII